MWNADASRIGTDFLQQVDDYLSSHLTTLTCHDMWSFYRQFWNDLKTFKGNANGFTGLSEYLIFRYVYHLLGGSFTREPVPGSDNLSHFVSTRDPALVIGQSTRVDVAGKRRHPDIVILHSGRLLAACSIKLSFAFGLKAAIQELRQLTELKEEHPEMRALLVIFGQSERGKIWPELGRMTADNEWFAFLVMHGNAQPLYTELRTRLALDTVLPAISHMRAASPQGGGTPPS